MAERSVDDFAYYGAIVLLFTAMVGAIIMTSLASYVH